MVKSILGIDPGKSGGMAVQSGKHVETFAFTNATEKDILTVLQVFQCKYQPLVCYLEQVHAMPGQGVTSMFSFGCSYGFVRGCVISAGIPLYDVTPRKWQEALGCLTKGDKNVTKARAQQWFPNIKVTHAIADALLIAEYGRRVQSTGEKYGRSPISEVMAPLLNAENKLKKDYNERILFT